MTDNGLLSSLKNQIISQQQGPNRNAGVSDIKSRPMPGAGVDDNEINHVAKSRAIGKIAGDSR